MRLGWQLVIRVKLKQWEQGTVGEHRDRAGGSQHCKGKSQRIGHGYCQNLSWKKNVFTKKSAVFWFRVRGKDAGEFMTYFIFNFENDQLHTQLGYYYHSHCIMGRVYCLTLDESSAYSTGF